MESIEELYPVFQNMVKLATGIETVILADQAGPAPTGLYATYLPIPVRAYGHVRRKRVEVAATEPTDLDGWTDFEETVCTSMQFMLSVNILNEGAATATMRLHNANFRAPVRDYLFAHKVAWRTVSDSRNLTGLHQAGLQPRYQSDIHLFIEAEVSYPVLRAAGFSVEVYDEDGNRSWAGPTGFLYHTPEFVELSAEVDAALNDPSTNGA